MITGKTIFITGGAGFIGSTLAGRLADDNDVILYDSLARNALRGSSTEGHKNLKLIQGDVVDRQAIEAAIKTHDPTHVVHCAAVAGIDTVVKSPVTTLEVNILGTLNTLRAATESKRIERVVTFSTSEVFGPQAFNSSERSNAVIGAVGEARWVYAVSKLSCEHFALAYHTEHGLPCVVLRPFNVYGPGQVGEGALSIFVQRAIRNQDLEIHGTGTQIRAWCYIDDMVDALLVTLENPAAIGQTFNIGNSRAVTTVYGLANTIVRTLDATSSIVFTNREYADIELRIPDVRKASEILAFTASVDLEDGILRTAEFYLQRDLVKP